MAPVYEGKGRPARRPRLPSAARPPRPPQLCSARGPSPGSPRPAAPRAPGLRRPTPGALTGSRPLPASPSPAHGMAGIRNLTGSYFQGGERGGGVGGGARVGYCPKKRNWEGAPGKRQTHDCAFHLFGINKVMRFSFPPPPTPQENYL